MILCTAGVTAGATRWALAAAWTGRRVGAACAAAHRVLAPRAKRMFLSPTYVGLSPCHGSHTRHRKAKSADAALENGCAHQAKLWEDVAKLATERLHPELTVWLILPMPLAHADLGTFPKGPVRHVAHRATQQQQSGAAWRNTHTPEYFLIFWSFVERSAGGPGRPPRGARTPERREYPSSTPLPTAYKCTRSVPRGRPEHVTFLTVRPRLSPARPR